MLTLKQLINRYIRTITMILIVFSLMLVSCIQINISRNRTYNDALLTLSQIEQIISENQQELEVVKEEYRQTCLQNGKVVSRAIKADPALLKDLEGLRQLAEELEIDEIHIFDKTGRIFTGTHPEYYEYTFDSGEQINFFKPLLTDKSLQLVQDIVPNTAEGKMMQYSALWSLDGEYIVQIGMTPVHVEKSTEKNELSYIFSLFRVNPNVSYYAIDRNTGEIVGSSLTEMVNKNCKELGINCEEIDSSDKGIHTSINGKDCFCVFQTVNNIQIGYVTTLWYMYREIPVVIGVLFLCMMGIALILMTLFNEYMKVHIVDKIHKINGQLASITEGDLNQVVDVRNVFELSELSTHINTMVQNILSSNTKLTYIFSKTNLFVGTYEYDVNESYIRFSEYIPQLFSLDAETLRHLSDNPQEFKQFIEEVRKECVSNEQNVYEVGNKYIKIDEITENNCVFGVVMDVTNEVEKRQNLEVKIHLDSITDLYNNIGMGIKLKKLFAAQEILGYYAAIVIMTDNLNQINQDYGYENGDLYLTKIAELITDFGIKNSIAARHGGGKFVLFLYGYENEKELHKVINLLTYLQGHSVAHLNNNINIPIRFSFGVSISDSSKVTDYEQLFREAAERKYYNGTVPADKSVEIRE